MIDITMCIPSICITNECRNNFTQKSIRSYQKDYGIQWIPDWQITFKNNINATKKIWTGLQIFTCKGTSRSLHIKKKNFFFFFLKTICVYTNDFAFQWCNQLWVYSITSCWHTHPAEKNEGVYPHVCSSSCDSCPFIPSSSSASISE